MRRPAQISTDESTLRIQEVYTSDRCELLLRARDYVMSGWTQGARARDVYGKATVPTDPSAIAWDLFGALVAANVQDEALYKLVVKHVGIEPMRDWNDADGRTKEEVIAVLDACAERARQKREESK